MTRFNTRPARRRLCPLSVGHCHCLTDSKPTKGKQACVVTTHVFILITLSPIQHRRYPQHYRISTVRLNAYGSISATCSSRKPRTAYRHIYYKWTHFTNSPPNQVVPNVFPSFSKAFFEIVHRIIPSPSLSLYPLNMHLEEIRHLSEYHCVYTREKWISISYTFGIYLLRQLSS